MHEQSIAKRIIEDASAHGEVKAVTIEVGDLAHLPADEMKEVLENMTDWEVTVVNKDAIITCECGYTGEPKILQQLHDNNIYECPQCGKSLPTILEGDEIKLLEVEIFEDEDLEDE